MPLELVAWNSRPLDFSIIPVTVILINIIMMMIIIMIIIIIVIIIIIIKGFIPILAVANALALIGWFERAVMLCGGTKAQK